MTTGNNIVHIDKDQPAIDRIHELMKNPPETSVILEITPGVASHVIEKLLGTHNRSMKEKAVSRYRSSMQAGDWLLNGATIVFTDEGLLGDGQNRMMACIGSNVSFKTHAVFGVPHGYFYSMDQGRGRTPADILRMMGVPNSQIMALVLRWAELLETNRVKNRTVFDPPLYRVLYDRHKAAADFLPDARHIAKVWRNPPAMVAAMLYTFDKIDSDFAADFGEAWKNGSWTSPFESLRKLQNATDELHNTGSGRVHETVRAAMIINAWNAARSGKQGKGLIKWDLTKPFPMIR